MYQKCLNSYDGIGNQKLFEVPDDNQLYKVTLTNFRIFGMGDYNEVQVKVEFTSPNLKFEPFFMPQNNSWSGNRFSFGLAGNQLQGPPELQIYYRTRKDPYECITSQENWSMDLVCEKIKIDPFEQSDFIKMLNDCNTLISSVLETRRSRDLSGIESFSSLYPSLSVD